MFISKITSSLSNLKKPLSLIMLSVSCSVAGAQIKVSGALDVGYGVGNGGRYENWGAYPETKGNTGKMQQWGNGRMKSWWGISGQEDLGSGMKAYFQLQSELNLEGGMINGFDRDAFVGLSGDWGAVQAGRQKSVSFSMMEQFSATQKPNITSSIGNAGVVPESPSFNRGWPLRVSSIVKYISPTLYGFKAEGGVILKNDDVWHQKDNARSIYELATTYSYEGLTVGVAYRSKPYRTSNHGWSLAAKYKFDTFGVAAGFTNNHDDADGKGFFVGFNVPLKAWTFGAQVAYNYDAKCEGQYNRCKPLAWELLGTYQLSKRTQLYSMYGGINNDAKKFQGAERNHSMVVGMIHAF